MLALTACRGGGWREARCAGQRRTCSEGASGSAPSFVTNFESRISAIVSRDPASFVSIPRHPLASLPMRSLRAAALREAPSSFFVSFNSCLS